MASWQTLHSMKRYDETDHVAFLEIRGLDIEVRFHVEPKKGFNTKPVITINAEVKNDNEATWLAEEIYLKIKPILEKLFKGRVNT